MYDLQHRDRPVVRVDKRDDRPVELNQLPPRVNCVLILDLHDADRSIIDQKPVGLAPPFSIRILEFYPGRFNILETSGER